MRSFSIRIGCILWIPLALALFAQEDQGSSAARRVRGLNSALLRIHGLSREQIRTKPAENAALKTQAASVLEARAAAFSKLMEENPQEALSLAFSSELVGDLAATFPD